MARRPLTGATIKIVDLIWLAGKACARSPGKRAALVGMWSSQAPECGRGEASQVKGGKGAVIGSSARPIPLRHSCHGGSLGGVVGFGGL